MGTIGEALCRNVTIKETSEANLTSDNHQNEEIKSRS